jgi:hypothetical protein
MLMLNLRMILENGVSPIFISTSIAQAQYAYDKTIFLFPREFDLKEESFFKN